MKVFSIIFVFYISSIWSVNQSLTFAVVDRIEGEQVVLLAESKKKEYTIRKQNFDGEIKVNGWYFIKVVNEIPKRLIYLPLFTEKRFQQIHNLRYQLKERRLYPHYLNNAPIAPA